MVSGICRVLQQKDPRKVRLEFGKRLWNEVWDNNPRIARLDEEGDFQVYEPRRYGLRPYCTKKRPDRWTWTDYEPEVGELYFTPEELGYAAQFAPDVIIEPHNKDSASVNKSWGWDRWHRLAELMLERGIKPAQVGRPGMKKLAGVDFIETKTFRLAAAVLAQARAAVLPEGGLHHAAAAVGVRAVVIYGGYISPRQTGYKMHVNLFTGVEPCGWRIQCSHCAVAMAQIKPEDVLQRLLEIRP